MKNYKRYIEMQTRVLASLDILNSRAQQGERINLSLYNLLMAINYKLDQQLTEVF